MTKRATFKKFTQEGLRPDKIKGANGQYNEDYLHYFQILGLAEGKASNVKVEPFHSEVTGFLNTLLQHLPKRKKESLKSLHQRVTEQGAKIWSPHDMHGAEYNNGGFQACVAKAARKDNFVFSQTQVDVQTDQRLSPHAEDILESTETRRSVLSERFNTAVPKQINTTVYVVAPRNYFRVTMEMVKSFATRAQEADSHSGIGFVDSVIQQSLSAEGKADLGDDADAKNQCAAWFEINTGIFFTTDKDMFEKVKIALNARSAFPPMEKSDHPFKK